MTNLTKLRSKLINLGKIFFLTITLFIHATLASAQNPPTQAQTQNVNCSLEERQGYGWTIAGPVGVSSNILTQGKINTPYEYHLFYSGTQCLNARYNYKINIKDSSGEKQVSSGTKELFNQSGLTTLNFTASQIGDYRVCWSFNSADVKCGSYIKITQAQETTRSPGQAANTSSGGTVNQGGAEASIRQILCTPSDASTDPSAAGQDLYACINRMYRFSIAFSVIAAVLMIVVAGYLYMASDGNEESVTKAKGILVSSITALVILFIAFILLREINPELVKFKTIQPGFVASTPGSSPFGGQYGGGGGSSTFILRACGKEFRSANDAQGQITTLNVQVWTMDSSGNKVSSRKSVSVNKCIANRISTAFSQIYQSNEKFPIKDLGGYNVRNVAGTRALSAHAIGMAIDINYNENAMIKDGKVVAGSFWKPCPQSGCSPYSIPANGSVVSAFANQGVAWGGNFNSLKDYMHFSCTENEHGSCP